MSYGRDMIVDVNCGGGGVDPVLDVGSAGEEKGTQLGADDANGAFCYTVELVDVGRGEGASGGGLVADLEKSI